MDERFFTTRAGHVYLACRRAEICGQWNGTERSRASTDCVYCVPGFDPGAQSAHKMRVVIAAVNADRAAGKRSDG